MKKEELLEVQLLSRMELFILVHGLMAREMVMETRCGLMVVGMKGFGRMIKQTDRESYSMGMELYMMVIG